MNILNIEAFLAIVETGNITNAAKVLYLTQSTVSHRLKILEQELNTKLIERKKGYQNIVLTSKGEEFIAIAERWVSLWRDTHLLQNSDEKLILSIGCVDSLNTYMFPSLYKQILTNEHLIDLQIRTHQSIEIYHLLDAHEIDIGFVLRPIVYKNIIIEPIVNEKMVLIRRLPSENSKVAYHPHELASQNEIFFNWNPDYRAWHDSWWNSSNRPHVHVDTASLILNLMDNERYWAIVPISMGNAFKKSADFQIYDILEPPPDRIIYKIIHKYPRSTRLTSIKILDKYLKNLQSEFYKIDHGALPGK